MIDQENHARMNLAESLLLSWHYYHTITYDFEVVSSGRALSSRSEERGFDPCPMLDGSGVKAMPGLIPTPNSGSL